MTVITVDLGIAEVLSHLFGDSRPEQREPNNPETDEQEARNLNLRQTAGKSKTQPIMTIWGP